MERCIAASPRCSCRHPLLSLNLYVSSSNLRSSCLFLPFTSLQLSAIDVSARTTMKDAANCDKHCDLQNSVNQWSSERKLHFRDIPESMPASVSTPFHATDKLHFGGLVSCACLCVRVLLALDAFSAWVVAVSTNNLKLIFDVLSLSRWWRFPLPVPSGTLPKT